MPHGVVGRGRTAPPATTSRPLGRGEPAAERRLRDPEEDLVDPADEAELRRAADLLEELRDAYLD